MVIATSFLSMLGGHTRKTLHSFQVTIQLPAQPRHGRACRLADVLISSSSQRCMFFVIVAVRTRHNDSSRNSNFDSPLRQACLMLRRQIFSATSKIPVGSDTATSLHLTTGYNMKDKDTTMSRSSRPYPERLLADGSKKIIGLGLIRGPWGSVQPCKSLG